MPLVNKPANVCKKTFKLVVELVLIRHKQVFNIKYYSERSSPNFYCCFGGHKNELPLKANKRCA